MKCARVRGHRTGVTGYKPTDVIDSRGRVTKTPQHVFMHYMSLQRSLGRFV